MGKYMRKAKSVAQLPRMELAQSSLGVRTRAKTLALQRLQKSEPAGTEPSSPARSPTRSGSYLQLRNRRLAKPSIYCSSRGDQHKKPNQPSKGSCMQNPNPNSRVGSRFIGSSPASYSGGKETTAAGDNHAEDIDASFRENVVEFETRGRHTRESTPCCFIRDPESIRTPCSSTRTNRATGAVLVTLRTGNSRHTLNPTPQEIDAFFALCEQNQQRLFIEKYNYDLVADRPLPGRFEWEKLDL